MTIPSDMEPLRSSIEALRAHGAVPAVEATLRERSGPIAKELHAQVVEEIAAFSSSGDPDVLPQLERHLEQIVDSVCRMLGNGDAGDLTFVRRYAQQHATHRFPLEAVLHTYRCSHRTLAIWIRDASLTAADSSALVRRVVAAAADFAIEFTNIVSTVATSEYVEHTRVLAEAESDRRAELLNLLLSGYDEADVRTAELLRRAGYLEQRRSFCVAVARSVNPGEMQSAARAQRMAEALGQVLRASPVQSLIGIRDGLVTAVVSGTRRISGWTAAQALLADIVYPRLEQVGPAALIGLSNDAPSTAHVSEALNEARLALDFATVSNRVMRYSQIPFREMIIRQAREHVLSTRPVWLSDFQAADKKSRGSLSRTLQAYADGNMNALRTAKALGVHPNTIYSRAQRIADVTGKNALRYHDLTELLLAIDTWSEPVNA